MLSHSRGVRVMNGQGPAPSVKYSVLRREGNYFFLSVFFFEDKTAIKVGTSNREGIFCFRSTFTHRLGVVFPPPRRTE